MKIIDLKITGFRSLKDATFHPGDLTVIIGPNGTGKSNLLRLLELISMAAKGGLGKYVSSLGGMEEILWDGEAEQIECELTTDPVGRETGPDYYQLKLARIGKSSTFSIEYELLASYSRVKSGEKRVPFKYLERGPSYSVIFDEQEKTFQTPKEFVPDQETLLSIVSGPFVQNHLIPPFQKELSSIALYHDIHTDKNALIRQAIITRPEKRVDPDGQNLTSVLHTLYTGDRDFKKIINDAMMAAFGDDFEEIVFPPAADQKIQLRIRWKTLKQEQSVAVLSDGTLRFLLLMCILASPDPSSIIAIDEPETGLHPSMLPIIAECAVNASSRSQIIFSTHSPQFLNAFRETKPTTIVAKWENGETTLKTLPSNTLAYWLKEYSLGSLFVSGELEGMK